MLSHYAPESHFGRMWIRYTEDMKGRRTKADKRDVRRDMHLTRPPRLEGVVKEAKMQPKRKKKKIAPKEQGSAVTGKGQDSRTHEERKQYHLKSPKPKRARRRA